MDKTQFSRKYRRGDAYSASNANAVNDALRDIVFPTTEPSPFFGPSPIRVEAHEDIPAFSVFTIDKSTDDGSSLPTFVSRWTTGTETESLFYNKVKISQGFVGSGYCVNFQESIRLRSSGDFDVGQKGSPRGGEIAQDENGVFVCDGHTIDDDLKWFVRLADGSGSGSGRLQGIVFEPIFKTQDPMSGADQYSFGKIRVVGQVYQTGQFDDCVNLYLAETEVAVRGMTVSITGPFSFIDSNGKSRRYYSVADWNRRWSGTIDKDLHGMESFTFEVRDEDDSQSGVYQFTAFNTLISQNDFFPVGTPFFATAGPVSSLGERLVLQGAQCPDVRHPIISASRSEL